MNIEIRDEALANRELDNQKIRRGLTNLSAVRGFPKTNWRTI